MRELDKVEKDFVFGKGGTCSGSNIGGVSDSRDSANCPDEPLGSTFGVLRSVRSLPCSELSNPDR